MDSHSMNNIVSLGNTGGFTRMDNSLLEALTGAELSGRELRVALAIYRLSAGYHLEEACIAASAIAQMTGIRREEVSRAICELIRQRVIYRAGGSRSPIGFAPVSQWSIDPENTRRNRGKPVPRRGVSDTSKTAPQCGVSDTSSVAFLTRYKDKEKRNILVPSELVDAGRQPEPCDGLEQLDNALRHDAPPQGTAPCPHQRIVDLYHEILPELPAVVLLNKTRRQHLQARWRESPAHRDLDYWREYFQSVKASRFLMGHVPGRQGARPFRASFDWLIAPSNFLKVAEGHYA